MTEDLDVAIVGGGPGGLSAGVCASLADSDLKIKVFERASSLRPAGFVVGILPNALKAIQAMDTALYESCLQHLTPHEDAQSVTILKNTGQIIMTTDGTAARERYAKYGGGLFPVAWYDLQRFWASHLPPGALQIGSLFDRYEDLEEGGVIVHLKDGRSYRAKVLIGADGNLSQVRKQLLADGLPRFAGLAIWRAMRERPADWPTPAGLLNFIDDGEKRKVMTYALSGNRLTWNVAVPWAEADLTRLGNQRYIVENGSTGDPRGKLDRCLAALAESDGGWPDYVVGMLRDTALEDITEHPLFYRDPADCHVYGRGRVTLLGDAAHLTAAALGQGTSQTMEDALELGRTIALHGPTPEALRAYESVRSPAAGAVQQASVDLVKNWGKLGEQWVLAEQRASERFFSRTFEPMPRAKKRAAAARTRAAGARRACRAMPVFGHRLLYNRRADNECVVE
ncbi:FAD/NAD(P)-binding domain-containing protein [Coccomyxa subellipsoidea C-169]|uniref:FAD/NAD(P)-binding domain-containing protein n=1 Tax=Coccomyxa subellipsoidea (strain C-169) TaxID=574566 RepID=I0YQX6_COCSC|nr:FAD/NAD(P)-binding domain-containing protein [Coccomyxa subellipsoidea C-169]EIE20795.1 FAD/NAD(P)-binding domain-containing protein [Coccomyxa subellipsoidea C-169]|eukprot:XP_005645339.1 FAD/NAD(P)-binding domain-containing protein [Coccomyxa subellipsoidea C-169]